MAVNQSVYAYIVEEKTYPEGAVIIHEGARNDWVYVILEGNVKIRKRAPRGEVTLTLLKEGAIIGEMAFLSGSGTTRSVSVVAVNGPVRVGVLDIEHLRRDYETVSPRMRNLISALVKRLYSANEKVCDLVLREE